VQAPAAFRQRLLDAIPRLRRYARSLVHEPGDADDLVQLTPERALAHWQQFDAARDIVGRLLSIYKQEPVLPAPNMNPQAPSAPPAPAAPAASR
jgi:hypothetical protein